MVEFNVGGSSLHGRSGVLLLGTNYASVFCLACVLFLDWLRPTVISLPASLITSLSSPQGLATTPPSESGMAPRQTTCDGQLQRGLLLWLVWADCKLGCAA